MHLRASVLGLVSSLVLSACATMAGRGVCPEKGGPQWVEVQSQHFRLRTNLSREAAEKTVHLLERYRASLALAFGRFFDPPGRVDVVVVRNQHELEEFTDQRISGAAGRMSERVFLVMRGEGYLVFDAPAIDDLTLHELAHYLASYAYTRQPRWVAEGFAQYLETLEVCGDETCVRLGRVDPFGLNYVKKHGRVSLEELWGWDRLGEMREAQAQAYYATSWAWVHFLTNKHPAEFDRFKQALGRAEDPRRAWEREFANLPVDGLDRELNNFIAHGVYNLITMPIPRPQVKLAVRVLTDADVHATRARIFGFLSKPGMDRSEAELAEALKQDPSGMALAMLDQPLPLGMAEKLAQDNPTSPDAWRAFALAQYAEKSVPEGTKQATLRKAATLNADDPNIMNTLAWHLLQSGQASAALPYAYKATALAPWSAPILDTHAAALAALGRCPEAAKFQQRAIDMLSERVSTKTRQQYEDTLRKYEQSCQPAASSN